MKNALVLLLVFLCVSLQTFGQTKTGTEITNKGRFDYKEPVNDNPVKGETPPYTITVSPKNIISVTPDSSPVESIAPNGNHLAVFQVCNEGNTDLDSIVNSVTANISNLKINRIFWDVDSNGFFSGNDVLLTVNSTHLSIPISKCLPVIVEFETGNIPAGTNFPLTLEATALGPNNNGADSGTRNYQLNRGAVFRFDKSVNGSSQINTRIGEIVDYELVITNTGDAPARNLVISDVIQGGAYVINSLKMNNVSKTDAVDADEAEIVVNRVSARISSLGLNESVRLSFQVQITSLPNGSSILNVASVETPSISEQFPSTQTQIVVNPKGVVFNAEIGVNSLIPNSSISVTDEFGNPVDLSNVGSFPANQANQNPFVSPTGEYAFALPCQNGNYILNAHSDGFIGRRIAVTVVGQQNGQACLLSYSLKALDGLPLADGIDGRLTGSSVTSSNVAGLFAFIPMFKAGAISVLKSVDKVYAQTGDILLYRIDFTNNSKSASTTAFLSDALPRGFYLAENSVEILRNGSRVKLPYQLNGNIISTEIGSIPANQTVSVFYRVRIGADVFKGENVNVAIAKDESGKPISDEGKVSVQVRPGIESERQTLVGRVFIDKNADGIYNLRDGDLPVAKAQVCTSQGRCALTDPEGKYSIATLPAGKFSVGLIRNTVGNGLLPKYHTAYDGDWSQIVFSPLSVGTLKTANFPLIEVDPDSSEKKETSQTKPREMTMTDYLQIVGAELASKENVKIVVRSVQTGKAAISAAVQVRSGNYVKLFLNGDEVDETTIGERIDQGLFQTLVYYNLNLKVGINKLEALSFNTEGVETGRDEKNIVKGGKAVKYAILPQKSMAEAGGRDEVEVRVVAFDENGYPAEDSEVMLTTSNGSFRRETEVSQNLEPNGVRTNGIRTEVLGTNQQIVKLNNGSGKVNLISPVVAGKSEIYLSNGYNSVNTQNALAIAQINWNEAPPVPTVIGFGEIYFGKANPSIIQMGKTDSWFSGRASLFGRVPLFEGVFTGSYQSNLPLNRDETFDRNLVNRLNLNNFNFDEAYSVFGDSSQRFTLAPSNTKAFARWEKNLNFVQFGDFSGRQKANSNGLFAENNQFFRLRQNSNQALEADNAPKLSAYNRNLTGLQIHLEDVKGNMFEIAGARPNTAFGRDIISPDGLSRIKLSAADILFGTETVTIETRDRRTPERVLKKETLIRDIDYEMDYLTGVIFLKSNVTMFDLELNPNQLVVSYEHLGDKTSTVILARGEKTLVDGKYRFGGTFNYTSQAGSNPYWLGGFDFRATLPNGLVEFEMARATGQPLGFGNNFGEESTGWAFLGNYQQRLGRWKTNVNFVTAQDGFNNPYGGIVQRGSTRLFGQAEYALSSQDALRFQVGFDHTSTENFNNHRETFGVAWKRNWNDKFSTILGYDFRNFQDSSNQFGDKQSHLVTAGLNWNPTKQFSLSVVREQNLSNENDPAYPNNTVLQAEYRINQWSKFFATNRFGGQINPIGDSSQIVAYQSRREFTSGFETKFKQGTSLMSAYRNEDGLNGQESFAVTGIGQKFNFRKNWSTDFGYQLAWKLAGESLVAKQTTYHNAFGGVTYAKENAFTANARYEFRNRLGNANLVSAGVAGKTNENWTLLGKMSFAQADQTFDNSFRSSIFGQIAGAYRPKNTDRYGMLFSYQFRDFGYRQDPSYLARKDAQHFTSVDAFYQPDAKWSLFGKAGIRYVAQSENNQHYSTFMSLVQPRVEYRFHKHFDVGSEFRWINEFKTNSNRFGIAAELGVWANESIRIGGGYNYQQRTNSIFPTDRQKGFYLTITTKLDRYFKIFGSDKPSGSN